MIWVRRLATLLIGLIAPAAALNFGAIKLVELTPGWPFDLSVNVEVLIATVLAVVGVFAVLVMFGRVARQWFADRDALIAAGLSEADAEATLRAAGR